jgi:DNA-binding transcriptional LysR family regulator
MLDEGVTAARLSHSGKRGRIRLGALGSLAGGLLGPALAEFVPAHPEVECSVKSADHEILVELLLDGIVELALITWPCSPALALQLTPLVMLHEPVVLVAHPKHPLARRRLVAHADLVRLARPLLRLRWWQTHHPEITRLAQLSGTVVEVPMETARHLVLNGVGAGFFTRTCIADELARRSLREVRVAALPQIFRDSALVRRTGPAPLPPATADLVAAIRAHARRLGLLAAPPHPKGA